MLPMINELKFISFDLGICGGSASGKTTVAQKIIESLDVPWVTLLSMDCFYKVSIPVSLDHTLDSLYTKSCSFKCLFIQVFGRGQASTCRAQ